MFAICLVSCDPGVTYYQRIENASSYNVMVTWQTDTAQFDSTIVIPNGEITIFEFTKIGHASEFKDCTFRIDSIQIKTTDTNLSYLGNLSYAFNILQEKVMYSEGECRAVISNSMFQ